MELSDLWGLGLIPLVIGLVELAKPFVTDKRFYPIVAVVYGVGLNMAVGWRLGKDPLLAALLGLVIGLSASGLYSAGATIRAGNNR